MDKDEQGSVQERINNKGPLLVERPVAKEQKVEVQSLETYDKVLFNPRGAIPVDFQGDNRLFVVEVANVVAVFRRA